MVSIKEKKTALHSVLYRFLMNQNPLGRPLLLALSGGPDSMALFYLLLDTQKRINMQFSVAHVDHGWRKESKEEYEILKKLCLLHGIAFHGLKLNPKNLKGNLEAACRIERQNFFQKLCQDNGYYAVLLGHHQDDHAETVLKRIFEGARLENCLGMSKIMTLGGIQYWRPLLEAGKKSLVQWLDNRNIAYFIDSSNADKKFLRARMRQSMIPELSSQFGKEIGPGLASFGIEIEELADFLKRRIEPWLKFKQTGSVADWMDFQDKDGPSHLFEARCLISYLFPSFSREMLYSAARFFLEGAVNKQFRSNDRILFVDRKRLFSLKILQKELPGGLGLLKFQGKFGIWEYRIDHECYSKVLRGWKQALCGELRLPLPSSIEDCVLTLPSSLSNEAERKRVNKERNRQKIPVFLRNMVPVLSEKGVIIDDFLLDRDQKTVVKPKSWITLVSRF